MHPVSDDERRKWQEFSDQHFAEQLEMGDIVEPDSSNPAHMRLLAIARDLSREFGVSPRIYISPLFGMTEQDRMHHAQYSLGGFRGNYPSNVIVIPEAADVFFTRGETEAVLAHEFDHVLQEGVFYEKMHACYEAQDAMREYHHHRREGVHVERLRAAEQRRDAGIERLSATSTRSEVMADERVIESGRASDMVSALQKMMICRELGEKAAFYTPEEVIGYISALQERQRQSNDPIHAAQHTAETFVQRLARLEKAAENEPERPSRGR